MAKNDFDITARIREARIRFEDLSTVLKTKEYVDFLKRVYPRYESTPAQILRSNMVDFMIYISEADGEISDDEARMICYVADWNITPDNLRAFASENDIFKSERRVAVTFEMICSIENQWARVGEDDKGILRRAVKLFDLVAELAMRRNGKVHKEEKKRANEYLKINKKYIKKNVLCPENKDLV